MGNFLSPHLNMIVIIKPSRSDVLYWSLFSTHTVTQCRLYITTTTAPLSACEGRPVVEHISDVDPLQGGLGHECTERSVLNAGLYVAPVPPMNVASPVGWKGEGLRPAFCVSWLTALDSELTLNAARG